MSATRVLCSACSKVEKENQDAHLLRSVKEKRPVEGLGCLSCARLALKDLNIHDTKELQGSKKVTPKNPRPVESKLLVADAGSTEKAPKKRRKKMMKLPRKEYVEYLEKHPLPPPHEPVELYDDILCDLQDEFVAVQKAKRDECNRIIKHYHHLGYAYKAFEVSDDEEEEV